MNIGIEQSGLWAARMKIGLAAIAAVTIVGVPFQSSADGRKHDDDRGHGGRPAHEVGSMGPVPKAKCGRSDRTESGLQGQTTTAERTPDQLGRTDSELGYHCNLELVGQFRGEGAFSQDGPSYFKHCAYMATENDPRQAHPGIVVSDVSDHKNPHPTE